MYVPQSPVSRKVTGTCTHLKESGTFFLVLWLFISTCIHINISNDFSFVHLLHILTSKCMLTTCICWLKYTKFTFGSSGIEPHNDLHCQKTVVTLFFSLYFFLTIILLQTNEPVQIWSSKYQLKFVVSYVCKMKFKHCWKKTSIFMTFQFMMSVSNP